MSRVAKKPIALAKGVEVNVQNGSISVKGPKGTLSVAKPAGIDVKVEGGNATLTTTDPSLVPLTGTLRAIVANMVHGVSTGFERKLELVGVGYRAAVQGKDLNLSLGYSHPSCSRRLKASPSPRRPRPRSSWPVPTSSWSAKLPPRSAVTVRRSPTRARV